MFLHALRLLKCNSPGSIFSYLCLFHYLALPWITALLPVTMMLNESAHAWLFIALTPAIALAAWMDYRKHRQVTPDAVMTARHIANGRFTLIHRIVMQLP
ncbi:MAG: MerC family mercury resistance protein [Pseudomonadota bacterium]|nr:MerC family mercury resistance protein [Pseudomonadota bacterium]